MPQIGPLEIVVVLLVALLVFGPRRLPEVGKQAARGLRELREFQANVRSDLQGMLDSDDDRDDDDRDDDTDTDDADDVVPPDPPEDAPALEAGTPNGAAPAAEAAPSDDTRPPGETPPASS